MISKMIPFYSPELGKGTGLRILKDILTGRIHYGEDIAKLEKGLAKFIGAKYAISFASGRYSLYLIYTYFKCMNRNVVAPAYTCIPAVDSIRWAGAKPYFTDIEPDTYNPKFNSSLRKLKNAGAICLSYLYGLVGDIEPFLGFAREKDIPVIEDSAIALGASFNGKKIGSIGDASVFSLQNSKIITAGRGGIIATNNNELYEWLLEKRRVQEKQPISGLALSCYMNYFRRLCSKPWLYGLTMHRLRNIFNSRNDFRHIFKIAKRFSAGNPLEAVDGKSPFEMPESECLKFSNLQASIALSSLEHIEAILKRRREMAELLISELSGNRRIIVPSEKPGIRNAYGRFPVRIEGKNKFEVQKRLSKKGIETALNYPYIIPQTQHIKKYSLNKGADERDYPNALKASKETFLLPFHTLLKDEELVYIAKSVKGV